MNNKILEAVGELEPTCLCGVDGIPGVVLDPFMGTGTTALAAEKHGRDWVGIELNPEYAEMAEERLAGGAKEGRSKEQETTRAQDRDSYESYGQAA